MVSRYRALFAVIMMFAPATFVMTAAESDVDDGILKESEVQSASPPAEPTSPPAFSSGPPMNPKKLWEIRGWPTPEIGRRMVFGNFFVTGDDGRVTRLRLMNGTQIWNVSLPGAATEPFLTNENILTTADGFYALRVQDGSVNFSHAPTTDRPSPVFVRQLDTFYTRGDKVVKLYTENGTVQWESPPVAPGISGPSAGDCCATALQVYKGNRIHTVYFANGSLQYTHDMPGDIYTGRVPVYNTYIYAGDSTGTFRAVQDIDGGVQWETKLGSGARIAPGVDRNDLVGATVDAKVYSMSVLDGSVNWMASLPAEARSQPEVIYNHAFFGAEDGKIYGVDLTDKKANLTLDFGAPVRGRLVAFYGILVVAGTDRIAAYDLYPAEFHITSHANGSYVSSRRVEFSGHGIEDQFLSGVQLSLDGKTWTQVGPQGIKYENLGYVTRLRWNASLDLQPGWNRVHARLIGSVGTEPVYFPDAIDVFVDDVAPAVQITEPPSGTATNSTVVAMAGKASDDVGLVKVEISSDNSTWVVANGAENWTGSLTLVAGTYDLYARATDRAVNYVTSSVEVSVVSGEADRQPPTLWWTSPTNESYLATAVVEMRGEASDNVDLRLVEWRVPGGGWSRCAGAKSWVCSAPLAEGRNDFEIRASDTFRNKATIMLTYRADWTAPGLKLVSPTGATYTNLLSPTIALEVLDDVGIEKVVASGPGGNATGTLVGNGIWNVSPPLVPGLNGIDIVAHDLAGNWVGGKLDFTLDQLPPSLVIEVWQKSTEGVKLFGSTEDTSGVAAVEARGDGGDWVLASGAKAWFVTVGGD
ncbi:MAG TPA: PQQ-binding-like beta-propeller repeat protein, partial [Thermoplasmata archaeon]|nr:PQQ-binding-like beta-propeller repeat protein [Thermoplasmata archaeon]